MWSWIKRLFSRPETPSDVSPAGLVAQHVTELLARQRADGDDKLRNAWHWGDCGAQVLRATRACESILLPLPEDDEVPAYLARVQDALSVLAERYRERADDPDGYGVGTVREVEIAMEALCRSLIEKRL